MEEVKFYIRNVMGFANTRTLAVVKSKDIQDLLENDEDFIEVSEERAKAEYYRMDEYSLGLPYLVFAKSGKWEDVVEAVMNHYEESYS